MVRDTRCPDMDIPCARLHKKDLIKVGRVRFKIRDIMSPVYREIESGVDMRHETHREMFPSMLNNSVSSSIIRANDESESESVESNADQNNNLNQEEAAAMAEAHQNALLTESDHEDFDGEPLELQHANTIL